MKTISLETSKRLDLKDIETEYAYFETWNLFNVEEIFWSKSWIEEWDGFIKTLTLEEAIEFLPEIIKFNWDKCRFTIIKLDLWYMIQIRPEMWAWNWASETWKTLLEAVENMLIYLLDNNLLGWTEK